MGQKSGYRQVTLYVDPDLYERVRCTSYALSEDIFMFVGEALASAIERRTTKDQRAAIDAQASMNRKNAARAARR